MARPAKNTFGAMSSALRSLGFVPSRTAASVVFTHPGGGPTILLPAYKSGDPVAPIHRMMVQKQLIDAGLIESDSSWSAGPIQAGAVRIAAPSARKASSGQRRKLGS